MQPQTLFINTDAPNRSNSLVSTSGSSATPLLSLPFVFGDTYAININFLNSLGQTSSLANNPNLSVRVGIGVPGQSALCLGDLGYANPHYTGSLSLATFELSDSLGSSKSRNYTLDVQVISSSFINTFQSPCLVYNQVVQNTLSGLSGSLYIISASYSAFALSASYAKNSSTASCLKVTDNTGYLLIGTGQFPGNPAIVLDNGDGSKTISIIPGVIALNDNISASYIRLYNDANSYIYNTYNFGIGTVTPTEKLEVVGNILCNSITASHLLGTSSWSANSVSSSYASNAGTTLQTGSTYPVTASWAISASQALTASTAISSSWSQQSITSSFASSASYSQSGSYSLVANSSQQAFTCSGIINANQYSLSNGVINSYTSSFTCSAVDDGRICNLITGSLVYLTGSLSSTFSTLVYQSGSGTVQITGSDSSVVVRQRQGFKTIGGQYSVVSIVRMPNGNFVLSGDLA